MDNKATTKRMIGAVVLVLVAALLLAALLRSKKQETPDMAMDNTSETKPILGFPGVSDDQKPSLVNEDPNAVAQQNQDGSAEQNAATAQSGMTAEQTQPEEQTVVNTTGFDVRPSTSDEARQVVDTDGKVKEGTGNMGGNEAVPSDKAAQTDEGKTQQATAPAATSSQQTASSGSASNNDKPVEPEPVVEKKTTSKPVLVGEKRVPNPPSAESAARKAAAEKAAAEKAAAEKAAAEKSRELATATTATGGAEAAAATTGGFAVQVMASADKAKADGVAGPLKADGHQVAVNKATVDGKVVYRVQITGFKTRADAANAQSSMKRRYTQNQYVQNSFVTAN